MEQHVGQAWGYEHSDYIPPAMQNGYWDRTQMVLNLVGTYRYSHEALCDIGCNAGHLLSAVGGKCWGYDIAISPLQVAVASGVDARSANITTDPLELAPVVTICEVLEHLDDPHSMVRKLNADPVRLVVASGPYLETEEDHYEQHCWAWDQDGFAKMFTDAGFQVVDSRTANIFQALVAVR